MRTDPPQQQMFVPTNSVAGASNQIPVMPVMFVQANPVIPAAGFTAWPQAAVMQPVISVQQTDAAQFPVEDFRKEVGKKLHFVLLFASRIL